MFFGGLPIQKDEEVLKNNCPHIVVGTPGRIKALVANKKLNLKHLKHFILDECDKMLETLGKLLILFTILNYLFTILISFFAIVSNHSYAPHIRTKPLVLVKSPCNRY